MKAVAFTYNSAEAKTVEVAKPTPDTNSVLIKVKFAALDTALEPVVGKTSSGGYLHKFTEPLYCGWHYSGTVEAIGSDVMETTKIGDEVFGHLQYASDTDQGSLAEYITVKEGSFGKKPASVKFDIAAASATESLTALQALKDQGGLVEGKQNQAVLINGAAGGVGMAAVQIAKRMGARVTAVCSTKDVEVVQSLGADVVIDRKKTPDIFAQVQPDEFDVIFDTPTVLPVAKSLKYLKPRGNYVMTAPHLGIIWGMILGWITGKGVKMFIVESKKDDLDLVGSWLSDGFKVDIDSTFPVKDIEKATARNRDRSKKGRVVVQVENAW